MHPINIANATRRAMNLTAVPGIALSLSGVNKHFGDHQVLRDLDLSIAPGEAVAIVGRSGCGKSTLLRLIAGLETPSSGAIQADGAPLRAGSADVRLMFQEARLLPWMNVLENVGVGLGLKGDWQPRARHALEEVSLSAHATKWPAQLSGGQRQRVALARALVHQPRLLLLDEPLGALDALTRLEMQQLIEALWLKHRCTLILVTHDVEEAVALCDRVLLVEDGQIVMQTQTGFPRPRVRAAPVFVAAKEQILARISLQPQKI
jgi:sulfonate transport system ATP-binding protein